MLTANVWYTFKEQPFSFSKTCLLYIFRGGRVMNLQQMYDILLKNNLSASQKHVYFIYFWEAERLFFKSISYICCKFITLPPQKYTFKEQSKHVFEKLRQVMNLQQMYDILLKNNLSASQKCLLYIFRGGRVMNLQQMYDILLKNNLSASHTFPVSSLLCLHEIYKVNMFLRSWKVVL